MAEATGGRRLLKATAVMASGTMASRVLGVVRTMMLAFVLGNGALRAEVFTLAMTVPNSLYMLLAGGTLNNVLVPQIVRAVVHDQDKGKAFIDRIMTAFIVALGVLSVLLTLAVPWVMSLYANPVWRTEAMAEQWQSLLLMSYITMPQIFFYGVFFLIGQVLNAKDVFGPMMWAPIVNNVVAIGVFGLYIGIWGTNVARGAAFTNQQVVLLAVGSSLGIALQTLVLLPYLKKAGIRYRPRFDLKGTGLGRTFHIAKWMVGYVALTSLAQVVVTNLASTAAPMGTGGAGITAYQNAYLIWILPHSLLTVSLATAMLPAASRAAVAGNLAGVTSETTRAVRLATTFLVPASLGLLVLADPITRVLFGNGNGADDYHYVAWALMAFAVGLVPFTVQYLYLRAFYAIDNTRTPFLLQIAISGANAAVAVALVLPFDDPGTVAARLALSYSVAYVLGLYLTHRALGRRIPGLAGRDTVQHLVRLLVAAVPAALVAWAVNLGLARLGGLGWQLLGLAVAAGLAVIVFFFTAKQLRIPEAAELLSVLRRRPAPAEEAEVPLAVEELVADGLPVPGEEPVETPGPAPAAAVAGPDPDRDDADQPDHPPAAVLDFPPPDVPAPVEDLAAEPTNLIDIGRALAGRYRLAELLAESDGLQTWRADDTVLTRPVLIHLLAEGDPRTEDLLDAARRAALATDSRFLRVLDVVRPSPGEHGAYIVYEYATGQTLQLVLAGGPLTGVETAWVVREVSDALVGLHADGLHHRRLSPATVLITASGNVKVTGLLVDEVLSGEPSDPADGEAADVAALGRLLYACLVARWPGGDAYGLLAAPTSDGRLLLPSQVRTGVAHPVDVVVDRILSPRPRQNASRLTTAAEVTTELSLVLGPISSAADLRLRLDRGQPDGAPAVSAVAPPVPPPARPRFEVSEELPEDFLFTDASPAAIAEDTPPPYTPVPPPASPAGGPATPRSPVPPPRPIRRPARAGLLILAGAVAIVAIIWLVSVLVGGGEGPNPEEPTIQAPTAVQIAAATDFDPRADGGSAQENPKQVVAAIDGDPETTWRTERYRTLPTLGGLKPGVGLVLDLGEATSVRMVRLTLVGGPTAVEVRVPAEPATGEAPMESEQQWRKVQRAESGSGRFELGFDAEVTRYVLVYLTELPPVGDDYYRGEVAEVAVLG